jgi:lipid-A-disaccharide synthase
MTRHSLFFSVGEPSGDIHASNLIRCLGKLDPNVVTSGFGGARMREAGCEILFPLVDEPVMGLMGALRAVPRMRKLLQQTARSFERERPSAVVLLDYPGFNWHMAKLAKERGIPVVYYVPPQIWAWASHRVERMKRNVDHILCSLPFEEAWYRSRGVNHAVYVGHPFFDDLALRPLDQELIRQLEQTRGTGRVALLPGSRPGEVRHNTHQLIRTARVLRRERPGIQLAVAALDERGKATVDEITRQENCPLEVFVGKTRELLATADAAVSVSGSVSLELLYFEVPSVMIYSIHPFYERVVMPRVLHSPYITLTNLLAGQRIFPEYVGRRDFSQPIARQVLDWLSDSPSTQRLRRQLASLKGEYADPGASTFAANYILHDVLGRPGKVRAA